MLLRLHVRIIAISGLSAGEVQESAADADAILQKPFTLTDLLRAVGGDTRLAA